MTSTSPVTKRDQELWDQAPICTLMPLTLPNGMTWESLEGCCKQCHEGILAADFRGTLTQPLSTVAVVEAVGACRPCRLLTRFYYRLHEDGRVTGRVGSGWGEWHPTPTVLDRLRAMWRRIRAVT